MNKFGDGISWEVHVDQVLEHGDALYYKNDSQAIADSVALINTDTPIEKRKALDCGCHVGRWVDTIRLHIKDYTGVDQCEKALDVARKNKPDATWVSSMLWNMPFNEEFDFACTIAVLQHNILTEQERIVPQIYKALKPGGVFFMTESTLHGMTNTQRTYKDWIRMVESFGFKFVKSFHPNELGIEDHYIFIKERK